LFLVRDLKRLDDMFQEGQAVTSFRAYWLSKDDHISGYEDIEASTPAAALEAMRQMGQSRRYGRARVEIWQGPARLYAGRLPPRPLWTPDLVSGPKGDRPGPAGRP
jgi:hypothetical protein